MSLLIPEMPAGLRRVMNLGDLVTNAARKFSQRVGLVVGEREYTWRDVDRRVNVLANRLAAMGVRSGDRILVQLTNGLPIFESAFAAFKLGAVWVPVNYRLTPVEVAYIAQSCTARAMISESAFREHAAAAQESFSGIRVLWADSPAYGLPDAQSESFASVDVDYDHPLWFFFTSGTTGKPKAAVLTHGQMTFVVTNHIADLMPGLNENDASLVLAPLSHGAGIHALVNVARAAKSVVLGSDGLDCAAAFRAIERHRITNLFTVPTILKRLVEDSSAVGADHSSLKHVIYAGAPMYKADQERALRVLGPVIVQYYGLGEVTGNITVLRSDEHLEDGGALLGTCGSARTGIEIAILDEDCNRLATGEQGEICTRGLAVFAGYWANPQANDEAFRGGWFHTGDLGKMDSRGFVTITGRRSDMFISGGSNIYPRDIEDALLTHPGVREAVVFGVPDETWGEAGVAIVVPQEGLSLSAEEVLEHLRPRIAKYKWPRVIQFWPHLPKSAYGKVAKKDIRVAYLQRALAAERTSA